MSDSEVVENIKQKKTWLRGVFMLLFVVLYSVAEIVMLAVVFLQFAFSLFTRNPNTQLTRFGMQLSTYMYSVFRFLTFNTETRPFPFEPWPQADSADQMLAEAEIVEPESLEIEPYEDEHEKL